MASNRLSEKFDVLADKATESANELKVSAGREKNRLKADADYAEYYAWDAISFAQSAIEEAEAASLDAVYARANAVPLSSGGALR